jgi:hypothetical protein
VTRVRHDTESGFNAKESGQLTEFLSEEKNVEQLLRQAMPALGFRKYINLNLEDGRALVNVFVHGIRRTHPTLTLEQGMEIIMDLATSGEDFGWVSNLQRGFFAALKTKFGKSQGAMSVVSMQDVEKSDCDVCGGGGIAILPKDCGWRGASACVCTKGRYYMSNWIKSRPNMLDLDKRPDIVELIRAEYSGETTTFKGTLRDALSLYTDTNGNVNAKRKRAI